MYELPYNKFILQQAFGSFLTTVNIRRDKAPLDPYDTATRLDRTRESIL